MINTRSGYSVGMAIILYIGLLQGVANTIDTSVAMANTNEMQNYVVTSDRVVAMNSVSLQQSQISTVTVGTPVTLDKLCVVGQVINHQEEPLAGWVVEAKALPGATKVISQTSDLTGSVRFDEGIFVGNWNFAIQLQNGWQPVTAASFEAPIRYGLTTCQVIRFKVRQAISVTVRVIDTDYAPLSGWSVQAAPGPNNDFALAQQTASDANGEAIFTLSPGKWVFTDQAPANITAITVAPPTGAQQELSVTAPGPYTIVFMHQVDKKPKGCIDVLVEAVPPEGVNQARFGLPGVAVHLLRADNSPLKEAPTDALGRITFSALPPSSYVVRATLPAGWEPDTPTTFGVTIADADACAAVLYYTRRMPAAYCIVGRVLDANGSVGLPNWNISAAPTNPNGYKPEVVRTNGLGDFRIDFPLHDERIPGSAYSICAEGVVGWPAHNATCQRISLSGQAGTCTNLPVPFVVQQAGHAVPEQPEVPTDQCWKTHIVQRGESLYGIGARYGVRPLDMLSANPWVRTQPNLYLYIGQNVCVPYDP